MTALIDQSKNDMLTPRKLLIFVELIQQQALTFIACCDTTIICRRAAIQSHPRRHRYDVFQNRGCGDRTHILFFICDDIEHV